MLSAKFLLGRGRDALSPTEQRALEDAMSGVRTVKANQHLARRGEVVTQSTLLIDGLVSRYMDDREGQRQIVAIHVPGDFVDLHGFPLRRLDHDVATLTEVTIGSYDHQALLSITERFPHLGRMLWFSTLVDAAMHREWIFRLGRLDAEGRVAHFMSEMLTRMEFIGLTDEGRFAFPITQSELAEACGVTSVHVNRVLRTLRESGLMTFRNGVVDIADRAGLARLGEFAPDYLYGDHGRWRVEGNGSEIA